MDPHGKKLGCIIHGAPATTNLAFGGDDWKTLYFTSRNRAKPRVFMPYIGGFPAYVEKCDAVADNAYEGFALA